MDKFRKAHEGGKKNRRRSLKANNTKQMRKLLRKYERSFSQILESASTVVGHIPKNKRGESLLRVTEGLTKLNKTYNKKKAKVEEEIFDPDGQLAASIRLNLMKSSKSESDSVSGSEIMDYYQMEAEDESEDEVSSEEDNYPGRYVLKPPSPSPSMESDDVEVENNDECVSENEMSEDNLVIDSTKQEENQEEKNSFNDETDLYDDIEDAQTENADDMLYEAAFESTAVVEKDKDKPQITENIQQQVANLHNVTIEPISKQDTSPISNQQPQPPQPPAPKVESEVVELLSSDDEKPADQNNLAPAEESAITREDIQFYAAGQQVILVLRHPIRIYFWGKFKVRLLFGEVCVMGYALRKSVSYDMYSHRGLGKLYFETMPSEDVYNPMLLFPILAETNLNIFNSEQIVTNATRNMVVLYLSSNNNILTSYINFLQVNPKPFPTALRAPPNSDNYYNTSLQTFFYKMEECTLGVNIGENWYDLCHHVHNSKILVCGGKDVGKSTFNRFLVNTQVQTYPVIYIDLDIGQPEFGFPGTISASLVEEPIFGPSYTHTRTNFIIWKFIRYTDVMKDTSLYINTVREMMDELWRDYHEFPWVINTMGFVKNFGDSINIAMIKLTKPSFVIQIHDSDAKNNYDCYMRPETVHQYDCSKLGVDLPTEQINFNHMLIMSETQSLKKTNNRKQNRDLIVISYFSHILAENKLYLTQHKPVKACLEKLMVWTIESLAPNLIASSLNSNIVALCKVDPNTKTMCKGGLKILPYNLTSGLNCLGFGIVRGISKDHIYLVTPLSLELMKDVNCIANCTQLLPMNMLTNVSKSVKGHAPFMSIKRDRPMISNVPKRNFYLQRSQANRTKEIE